MCPKNRKDIQIQCIRIYPRWTW